MCVPLLQVCRPLRTVQSWSLRGVASRALVDYGLNLQMVGGGLRVVRDSSKATQPVEAEFAPGDPSH